MYMLLVLEKPTEYGKIRRIKYDGTSLAEVE